MPVTRMMHAYIFVKQNGSHGILWFSIQRCDKNRDMWKYIRLLRLQDQYVELSSVLSAGIFLHIHDWRIVTWALATILLSIPTYMVNEIVDRQDADIASWNPNHVKKSVRLDMRIVFTMCIVLSILGFVLSLKAGLFGWGIAMWTLGMLYSIEPIRFKRRFALDLFTQPLIWWSIPFLAVTLGVGDATYISAFLVITTAIIIATLFPYQIADYFADAKAGLLSTHVVLGVKQSLLLGSIIGIVGLVLFFVYGMYRWAMWMSPFAIMITCMLFLYTRWMRMDEDKTITRDIQYWVTIVKPMTQLLSIYFFVFWRFFS